jgi:hypothetical protein
VVPPQSPLGRLPRGKLMRAAGLAQGVVSRKPNKRSALAGPPSGLGVDWTKKVVLAGSAIGPAAVQLVADPEIVQTVVTVSPTTNCISRDAPGPGATVSWKLKSRATVGTEGLRSSRVVLLAYALIASEFPVGGPPPVV